MDYDVLIIGSGFGGSVSALRLTEKGYRVGVLEAGRRFADAEFAKNSWHVRDYLFAPRLGCTGIFRMTPLHHHFEMLGWEEITVVIRFWLIAGIFVAAGLGLFYAEWVAGV